ncbi:MAG: MFS transporter [Firmicutes bacterium HGW-Firmicutes-11]|jgi:hypothetical protein|nr:MAG: MFS transporter [Firmicutes bacterium HGW-Firmicutes-11]
MFREVRRKDREITGEELDRILESAPYGYLSTAGADGYPYGVPISYVYDGTSVYFHCAVEGHKLDNIARSDKVSFCAVSDTEVLPDQFSTNYKSVVLFGRVRELTGEEKEGALRRFLTKYSSEYMDAGMKYIEAAKHKTRVFKIEVEHRSGKSRR